MRGVIRSFAVQQPWSGLTDALSVLEIDLRTLLLAWARVAPTVLLVPAFGLRAVAAPVRVLLGIALAVSVAPALAHSLSHEAVWPLALVTELVRGLPVALSAAAALWAAEMAGGLVDDLRGVRDVSSLPIADGASPMGALMSLSVSLVFLESGGPARVLHALTRDEPALTHVAARAVLHLTSGIELAVAVAAPIVVAAIVVEVASSLFSRAMVPAPIQPALAPLRSLLLLGVLALVLDRVVGLLALNAVRVP